MLVSLIIFLSTTEYNTHKHKNKQIVNQSPEKERKRKKEPRKMKNNVVTPQLSPVSSSLLSLLSPSTCTHAHAVLN